MPTAFRATYADIKLIKTRQTVQVIFEIPQSDFDAAYEVLGGLPNPAAEKWFGIAALQPAEEEQDRKQPTFESDNPATPQLSEDKRSAGAKREWRDLPPAQQAGIRCDEPIFAAFLKEQRPDDWHESQNAAECVRLICGVQSRSELGTNQKARVLWTQLNAQFEAWKMVEHA
jgi:hypothetical protein